MSGNEQKLLYSIEDLCQELEGYNNVFAICGDSSLKYCAGDVFELLNYLGIQYHRFGKFSSNPTTEDLKNAIEQFKSKSFDAIISIGGGSAIDIGKCVKLYANEKEYDWSKVLCNSSGPIEIPLVVMPTTAGSGSEATRFAVIYHKGVKCSITNAEIIPDYVFFDYKVLRTLPLYQKKATLFDALCHSIESYWSINSTDESKLFSRRAIALILERFEAYISMDEADDEICKSMHKAAYYAGRAINITQTTAGHAMAYKLTGLYGCAHGHAVVLVLRRLWPWMIEHIDLCNDPRGTEYLSTAFSELDHIMGCNCKVDGAAKLESLFAISGLEIPMICKQDLEVLVKSVNPERLKNNPIKLTKKNIKDLYRQVLNES